MLRKMQLSIISTTNGQKKFAKIQKELSRAEW